MRDTDVSMRDTDVSGKDTDVSMKIGGFPLLYWGKRYKLCRSRFHLRQYKSQLKVAPTKKE